MPEAPKLESIDIDAEDVQLRCDIAGVGPLVIGAHGFPDSSRTFRFQVPALVDAGFRVALVTMRGYAPSTPSRRGRYDALSLGRDLLAVADALSPRTRVLVLGHDWGAIAAYAAAGLRPERIAATATMAVPPLWAAGLRFLHPKQLRRSWYMAFFQLDRAEAALCRDEFALIDRLWRDWSPGYRCPPAELAAIKAALAGAPAAVLGYYRAFRRWKLGAGLLFERPRVPGLYLHGRDDGCIGAELMGSLSSASIAGFQAELLDDAGHFLHLEQPDKVNALLVAFMSRYRE